MNTKREKNIADDAMHTLEYGINAQVVINVQVGYFLQNNKHTGLNKQTGGNISSLKVVSIKYVLTFPIIKSTTQ